MKIKTIATALGVTATLLASGSFAQEAQEYSPPSIENFGQFKKNGVEVMHYSADTTDGFFARAYVPSEDLGWGQYFGDFSNQVHFWGQGIYGSGKVKWDLPSGMQQPDINLTHYSIGAGIGAWQPVFESVDSKVKVAISGNIGVRLAYVDIDTQGSDFNRLLTGIPFDFGAHVTHADIPKLMLGFALLDPGIGHSHDDTRMGPFYASYQFTPKLKAVSYLGPTTSIGVEWGFN
ncbi:hypothetical protein [Thiomicrospira sp.]|uniref:hypothetical protein n=1 Tax=Thiomicrospira sp. TaxID=935 RepID=UPI002F94B0DB